ncbi:hypothetical protein HGA91_02505 [candidate division WWE3 bacterium]|nr:hypothetical protein [candidate division WWE3 bacterium]
MDAGADVSRRSEDTESLPWRDVIKQIPLYRWVQLLAITLAVLDVYFLGLRVITRPLHFWLTGQGNKPLIDYLGTGGWFVILISVGLFFVARQMYQGQPHIVITPTSLDAEGREDEHGRLEDAAPSVYDSIDIGAAGEELTHLAQVALAGWAMVFNSRGGVGDAGRWIVKIVVDAPTHDGTSAKVGLNVANPDQPGSRQARIGVVLYCPPSADSMDDWRVHAVHIGDDTRQLISYRFNDQKIVGVQGTFPAWLEVSHSELDDGDLMPGA